MADAPVSLRTRTDPAAAPAPGHTRRFMIGLGTAAAFGGGCSRRASRLGKVRVSLAALLNVSPFYVAYESGYFAKAGLDLELYSSAGASLAFPLLAGGEMDVALTSVAPALINAVVKGVPVKIVAGREIAAAECGSVGAIYGSRRSFPRGLSDLRALRGKRVAVRGVASTSVFALDALLEKAGLRLEDLKLVNLRQMEAAAALAGGKIDALVSQGDFERDPASLSPDIIQGPRLSDVLPNYQYSYVIFGKRLLDGDLTQGARFLQAYLKGAREFLQGKTPRYMDEFARANGMDPALTRARCRNTFTADGSVDLASLQYFIDWTVRKGYCAQRVEAARMVDLRFLEHARRLPEL